MAQPITWQNVLGPSLADASRPLEAAQRTFSGMFDNLGGLLKDAETRQETGRNILKDKNADILRDLYARAKTPEQVAAAQQQEAMLRAQMGDMLRSGDVRGLDEQRLVDVRNQTKQGMEFDNFLKDERSKPFMEAYRAAAIKGDKVGMANAEAAYTQVGGPKLSALMEYGDSRQWLGKERANTEVVWDRDGKRFVSDMETARINRDVAVRGAAAQEAQVGISRDTYGLNAERLNLERIKAREASEDRLMQQRSDIVSKVAAGNKYSPRSSEGAAELAAAAAKLPESMRDMGASAIKQLTDANVPVGDAVSAINGMQQTFWGTDSGDVTRAVQNAIKNASAGNIQSKTASFQADQYLRQLEENKQRLKMLDQTYAQGSAGRGPSANHAVPPKLRGNSIADGGYPIEEVELDRPSAVSVVPNTVAPVAAPAPVLTPKERLDAAFKAYQRNSNKIGSPEMTELRAARAAYNDSIEAAREQEEALVSRVGKATDKREDAVQRLNIIQHRLNVLNKEADKFKGRKIPANVAYGIKRDAADVKILKERLGIQ